MISIEKKFLFIHVPKTGGNSIQQNLRDFSEDKIESRLRHQDGIENFGVTNDKYGTKKHSPLSHYKEVVDPHMFKSLFKFSTIRNPWDMCISFYFSPHRGKIDWDRDKFKEFIQNKKSLMHYISTESYIEKINRKLKLTRLNEYKPLTNDIDFLIRFENLNEDFRKVCEIIEIPFKELPHRNKSSRYHYTKYYDSELIELVKKKFKKEIKYANYIYGE